MSAPATGEVTAAATPGGQGVGRRPGRGAQSVADAAVALAFLTRLPVPATGALSPGALGRSAAFFPAVGVLVGGVLGGTRLLADLVLPAGPATAIALLAAILVTGALHEDGLADTADGLGAHATRERKLEIMRDPRVGVFGAVALVGSLGLAWSLLSGLSGADCLRAAIIAHTLGRWAMPVASALFVPARADGAGRMMIVTSGRLVAATVPALAIACVAGGLAAGLAAAGAALLTTAALGSYATRKVGGITGDVYGATAKLVELASLAAVVAVWTH